MRSWPSWPCKWSKVFQSASKGRLFPFPFFFQQDPSPPPFPRSPRPFLPISSREYLKEPLHNSSLNHSETGKKKRGFSFPHIFKGLSVLKMAAHPWAAVKSELIRLYLRVRPLPPCRKWRRLHEGQRPESARLGSGGLLQDFSWPASLRRAHYAVLFHLFYESCRRVIPYSEPSLEV